jgi:hypothetical protein
MNIDELIALGNTAREQNQPELALSYYAQAFVADRRNPHAFNNYGNVLRECGDPTGAIPFLQYAIGLTDNNSTAKFNLAVSYLLAGDYKNGWAQYETRWNFEHLAGTLPTFSKPQWSGQDLKGKTIFVIGEQGHGDNIQFYRFLKNLIALGGQVIFRCNDNLSPLFANNPSIIVVSNNAPVPEEFDYWSPIMSLPGILSITLENLPAPLSYISAQQQSIKLWQELLGPKKKLRIGFCWRGRPDSWLNRHKGMPFETVLDFIKKNPDYEWINLQVESTQEENELLKQNQVLIVHDHINNFSDTAGLIHHIDVVISVDTSIAHLASAMGRPTWIPLNAFGTDWRWLLNRDNSPWYPSARLFRQPTPGDWNSCLDKIHQYLSWFKI